jgi:hypothetical protein
VSRRRAKLDDTVNETAAFNVQPTQPGKIQQKRRKATTQSDEEERAVLIAPPQSVAVSDNSPLSFDEVRQYRPNYLRSVPTCFVDVYHEFKGIGQYLDQPVVGGMEKLGDMCVKATEKRTWKNFISGNLRHYHVDVIALARLAESKSGDETSQSILQLLQKWDALLAASGASFWDFYRENLKPLASPGDVQLPTQQTHTPRSVRSKVQSERERNTKRLKRTISKSTASHPMESELLHEVDNDHHYVEETSFLYHDRIDHLSSLPPPLPIEHLIKLLAFDGVWIPVQGSPVIRFDDLTVNGHWSYNQETRVLMADFRHLEKDKILSGDLRLYRTAMEVDDITVVGDGLFSSDDDALWSRTNLSTVFGSAVYNKFKRFKVTKDPLTHVVERKELNEFVSMRVEDYVLYLNERDAALKADECRTFEFQDFSVIGEQRTVVLNDIREDVIYMIDVEMPSHVKKLYDNFTSGFKLSEEFLPGGDWCMMKDMPPSSMPFMGPNVYIW